MISKHREGACPPHPPLNSTLCDLQQNEIIRSFGDNIYTGYIYIKLKKIIEINLLENILDFNDKSNQKQQKVKIKKGILMKVYMLFMKVEN